MTSADVKIEKLQQSDIEIVAALLANTFETNPAYALIFKKKDTLWDGLYWLFKTNLILINKRGTVTSVAKEKATGNIIGVYSLLPPGGVKSAFSDYLHIDLPQFIVKFGFGTLQKMLGMDSYNKQLLNEAIHTNEYYYLSMVAIKQEYRGEGIGSFMIRNCIDELKSRERKCHLVGLTTQLPENVTFYAKLGFQKLNEGEVQFKENRYYNYNIKYDL
jgi:ribosomal protein S18 acetylase RimI-like enzyme